MATKEYSRIMLIPAKKSIIDRVQPAKNSTLVPMPTAGCLVGKRLTEYPRVVRFNQVDPFQRDTIPMECKDNQFMWDGSIWIISDIKP